MIGDERKKKVSNYPGEVEVQTRLVDSQQYTGTNAWKNDLVRLPQKRKDPDSLRPEQVEAEAGVFAVMMRTTKPDDAWEGDKDAIDDPKDQPKPKPKPKKERKPRMPAGMGSDMYGSMPGYPGGEGEMGMPSMPPGMGDEGMMSGYGGGMTTAGRRQLGQFYISHYLSQGYRPGGGGGMMPGMPSATPGVAARSYNMVAVKVLVPYEKQWEKYEEALANATGYNPMLDVPRYLFFAAERAEVPDDPNAELQWQPISDTSFAMKLSMKFAGFPAEVADEAYLLPLLTMPIPPVLLQPYESLALHSEVPKKQLPANLAMSPQPPAGEQAKEGTKEGAEGAPKPATDFSEGLPQIPVAGAARRRWLWHARDARHAGHGNRHDAWHGGIPWLSRWVGFSGCEWDVRRRVPWIGHVRFGIGHARRVWDARWLWDAGRDARLWDAGYAGRQTAAGQVQDDTLL